MPPSLAIPPDPTAFDPLSAIGAIRGEADWLAMRYHEEDRHHRSARNGRPEQNSVSFERGVMIEALVDGQIAYAATSNLTAASVLRTARRAARMARAMASCKAFHCTPDLRPVNVGAHRVDGERWLDEVGLAEFSDRLIEATRYLKVDERIVTATAEASFAETRLRYVTSSGGDIEQRFRTTCQHFAAIAQDGGETQQRSLNGPTARCWQGGLESFDWAALYQGCERVGHEALALLYAENCPDETLDLILAPDQMLLQIHESIGHPLELDRILGDERNYAGWSFVKPEDFGRLQYGSPLLNATFDPGVPGEFASYAWDDGGARASREFLIRDGRLLRGLGGLESQARLGLPGVANCRSTSWNRAPIDRMGNINLEPGTATLEDMIANVRRGVYMEANRSWSIDDYRNKFQFGCEYARLIEDGRLTRVLKNPNYRGITVPFWHSLDAVGHAGSVQAFGTPYCGKGEPNQVIRVGHAAPPCRFRAVEVFGGDT